MRQSAWCPAVGVLMLLGCGATPKAPEVTSTERPETAPTSAPPAKSPPAAIESAAPAVPAKAPASAVVTERGRALLTQAREAAGQGDVGTAQARLKEALADSPGLVEVHYNLGVVAEWMGRVSTAKTHYEDALKLDSEHLPSVVATARLLARGGDMPGAERFARAALERAPNSLALRNAYDRIRLLEPGRAKDVAQTATQVLRKDEKNVEAMVNLAMANIEMGRQELALAILDNARLLQPQNPEILVLKALAYDRLSEDRNARAALEEAIALPGGGSAEAHNNLGLLYHEAGDYQGAEAQFRAALLRWPNMLAAHVNLANALKGQQRFGDAQSMLKRATALDPDSPEVAFNMGILYLDGQLQDLSAIARLEQAVAFFERYKTLAKSGVPKDDPVDSYIEEARKRIEVEKKREEQLRRSAKPAPEAKAPADEADAADQSEPEEEQ